MAALGLWFFVEGVLFWSWMARMTRTGRAPCEFLPSQWLAQLSYDDDAGAI